MGKSYRQDLDFLKGLAIIAVMLYHAGWCKSGYLGVDVFLVISGYLTVPKVIGLIGEGRFRYWYFLENRLFRLLPVVLIVCCLSLAVGYWGMLPGDYRYLSEEVMAALGFAENILQSVTTQNYWAAIYHKVLMHTWYLGVLMQFYVVFPALMLIFRKSMRPVLVVLMILSLVLYLLPVDTIGDKYYLLPYRFFEIAAGGLMAMRASRESHVLSYMSLGLLALMVFFGAFTIGERAMPYNLVGGTNTIRESFLPREMILLLTVAFALLYLYSNAGNSKISHFACRSKVLSPLGRMSLSLFLWHQPLFAFYRYFFADKLSWQELLLLIMLTILLSMATYLLLEKRIRIHKLSRICLLLSWMAVNAFSLWIYHQGGAVRDVPELGIRQGETDPKFFERYTDRIYDYDKEFSPDSTKKKILIVGNSFARDFANILLESSLAGDIQLSYCQYMSSCPLTRVQQCDCIYFFGWKHNVPSIIWKNLRSDAVIWGIGTKNHGTNNGIFYKNRYRSDYFSQTTAIHADFHEVNRLLREEWQEHYIDFLSMTIQPDGAMPVFTPDHHFITYDSFHLTPYGARYYAQLLFDSH